MDNHTKDVLLDRLGSMERELASMRSDLEALDRIEELLKELRSDFQAVGRDVNFIATMSARTPADTKLRRDQLIRDANRRKGLTDDGDAVGRSRIANELAAKLDSIDANKSAT